MRFKQVRRGRRSSRSRNGSPPRRHAKLLVLGQSHVHAFRSADLEDPSFLADRGVELQSVLMREQDASLLPGREGGDLRLLLDDWRSQPTAFFDAASDLFEEADRVLVLWKGNQVARTIFAFGPEFDFVLPGEESEPPDGVEVLPCSIVEDLVQGPLDADAAFGELVALLNATGAAHKLVFLAPPPPFPASAVKERLAGDVPLAKLIGDIAVVKFASQLDLDLGSVPLVPDPVRLKMWKILVDVYARWAERCGGTFLPPPPAAAGEDGMLAPEYCGTDLLHASTAYGRLYLDAIVEHALDGRT